MKPKPTLAGIGASAIIMGGVDASVLNETPLEHMAEVANERVEARQIGNVVETRLLWKGEPGLTVKYDMGKPTASEKAKDKRKKEVITEVVDNSQGFKMDIILNEKPATNCFTYQIEGWEDYDFFYQPPLTPEEIAEGAERPEEIVGSYAVYHKTLKNHRMGGENYATGKMAHIPYPYVWEVNDEAGTKQRAESFNITDGNMTVCAPQSFLNNATYPVRIDPTFGYTTSGASEQSTSNRPNGSHFTAPEDGTVTHLTAHIRTSGSGSGSLTSIALYNYVSDSDIGTLIDYSDEQSTDEYDDWTNDLAMQTNPSVTGSTVYYLVTWMNSAQSTQNLSYDTVTSAGILRNPTRTYSTGSWEDPFTSEVDVDRRHSIYATYTATGGGTTGDTYWDDDF